MYSVFHLNTQQACGLPTSQQWSRAKELQALSLDSSSISPFLCSSSVLLTQDCDSVSVISSYFRDDCFTVFEAKGDRGRGESVRYLYSVESSAVQQNASHTCLYFLINVLVNVNGLTLRTMEDGEVGRQFHSIGEQFDTMMVYGECRQRSREAAGLYQLRYPDRRHTDNEYFHRLAEKLQQTGPFHGRQERPRLGNRQMALAVVNAVRENVVQNSHTSTRAVGRDLDIPYLRAHRVLKKYLKWRPWKRTTVQKLQDEDLPRRMDIAEWIVDQVILNYLTYYCFYCDGKTHNEK